MCELPCFDLLRKSGFNLNLNQFKDRACDYLHYPPMISGTLIYVSCLFYPVLPFENLLECDLENCLSFENCRYCKALKTLLTYVKVLDRPSKENYNDIFFIIILKI